MNNLASYGFWIGAAVYAAIGVFGMFFLSTQPNIATATDGYGTIHVPVRISTLSSALALAAS